MAMRKTFSVQGTQEQTKDGVLKILEKAGWKSESTERDGGTLFFSQKGAWTRLGVIIVHVSILVIFAGSLIGSLFGYKASDFPISPLNK